MDYTDIKFLFTDDNRKRAGYGKNYVTVAQKTLKPYLDAGKVVPFSGTSELLPSITGTVHPGHTPGSAFYTLNSRGVNNVAHEGDLLAFACQRVEG